jgi:hypothetical protein
MGHKGPALRPRCIGAVTSLTLDIRSLPLSLFLSLLIYEGQELQNELKEYKVNYISCNNIKSYNTGSHLVNHKFHVYYDSCKCKKTHKFITNFSQSRGINEIMGLKP